MGKRKNYPPIVACCFSKFHRLPHPSLEKMNEHYANGKMKIEPIYQHPHLQRVQNGCHIGNSSQIQQRQTSSTTTPNIYPRTQLITGAEWQAIVNNTLRSPTPNGYFEYSAQEIIVKPKEMIHNSTLPHLPSSNNYNNSYSTNQLINENGDTYMHLNFLCTQMLNVLKDSIEFSKKQIDTMLTDHAADRNFSQLADYEILYQVKPAQHRLRQLQLQLIAIQELKGKYLNTLTMNRTAVKCELDKPARRTVQRLKKARNRFADITQDLAKLQAETEVYMGSLIFQPKGIVGFARITCGDEFELVIKHGSQKAKMRTKIGKDRVQTWNPPEAVFKCFLGEIFELKVYEMKSLGKRQLLDTYFYYVELICSQPTALTINLKRSGTVKLYLVINWDPLDFTGKSNGNCGVHSVRWKSLTSFGRSKQSRPKSWISSFSPKDQRSTNIIRSASACGTQTMTHIPRIKSQTNIAETSNTTDPLLYTLDKMVYCSKQLLQKYPQLKNLYSILHLLRLKIQESTMQCITSDNTNEPTDCIANQLSKMHMFDVRADDPLKTRVSSNRLSMHESSLRTLNSMVACDSFYHQQSENTKSMCCSMEAKLRESPFPNRQAKASPSELRMTVKHHLVHIQLLIQQLDKVGPMKAKEAEALRKITEEIQILKLITKLSDDHLCLPSVSDILGDLDTSVELQNIWLAACCKANRYLLPLLQLSNEISQLYGTSICSYYPGLLDKVMASMRHMLTDESTWLPHEVTVFQFVGFFKDQQLSVFMEYLSHETWINEGLKSRNIKEIRITLDRLKQLNTLPPTNCLRYTAMLLVDEQSELYSASENYLHSIDNNSTREEMINQYIAILEHDDPMSRRGACRALALLNAQNAIELLVFLSSHDHNPMVRNEARNSLFKFGISKL